MNGLKNDISNIPGPGDLTYMGEAMLEALEELNANGNNDHSHVIILLTDGAWNGAVDPIDVAYWARENDTYIYTISLGGGAESTLKGIANITGAEYFYAETAEDLRGIFNNISTIIDKTAGRDSDINDAIPMIRDVLPPWIDYVPGSFSIPPDYIYTNESGYTIIEWNVSRVLIDEIWEVTFDITSTSEGLLEANNFTSSRISYINWAGSSVEKLFPRTMINVINPPPPEPLPPRLFIEIVNDSGDPEGRGDNIRLNWTAPTTEGVAYYLIYRSEDQRDFDFQTPWVNTSSYSDNGIIPLRTTLNDTHAAKPGGSNFLSEWYYTIRAVNTAGNASSTSRTVGKWTRQFHEGVNTFSLPLEPLQTRGTDWYVTDMNAMYIKWMNDTHQWVKHDFGEGAIDNTSMLVGCGYEVKFQSAEKYSFIGMPGAMIQYDDDPSFAGFNSNSNAKNLTAMVKDFDVIISVTLNWLRPAQMEIDIDHYKVYYSSTRDGFWGTLGIDYELYTTVDVGTETATFGFLTSPDMQLYFMVEPELSTGEIGTSTYSIGIFIADYDSGYDTIGLPLKPSGLKSVDWFCDDIPNILGINYYNVSEQRWIWHKQVMPAGAYDVDLEIGKGYQISTLDISRYSYVGF